MKKKGKYVFIVGGVMSGIGKGITTSSIGKVLQMNGYFVSAVKIDPYINVDAGTLNPKEHGETFVLDDGHETDQDMGNYERFLNISLTKESYITTGSIYQKVIEKERKLFYNGKTVSVVPHIPLAVIEQIQKVRTKQNAEILLVEIGGTVGEYENILFLEAARMMKRKYPNGVAFVLVSYLPILENVGEMKTKPTQQAIRNLQESGIFPDLIIARSKYEIDTPRKRKIAEASLLKEKDIINSPDLQSIYELPLLFEKEKVGEKLLKKLGLSKRKNNYAKKQSQLWNNFASLLKKNEKQEEVLISIVGKYFLSGNYVLSDAYISVIEALTHASLQKKVKIKIQWIHSKELERKQNKKEIFAKLRKSHGILVPGGFGKEGIHGKDIAIQFARENKIPFLGLCLGFQRAAIEFAKNECGIKNAESEEMSNKNITHLITTMEKQKENIKKRRMGGSMRLGAYEARIQEGTLASSIYKQKEITERHRHRYELNPKYVTKLEECGMRISAWAKEISLPEILELNTKIHPFFLATQFHPELKSRPLQPHPIFLRFVEEVKKYQNSKKIIN